MKYFNFRKITFWFVDFLKGNPIKKHLTEIKTILENPNSLKSQSIKEKHLKNLLKHASEKTLYYSDFKNVEDLNTFPVIKKTTIQENFNAFKSSKFQKKSNYKVSTSGSTGVPFFLYQNNDKRLRNKADILYFSEQSEYTIGNKLYHLGIWRNHNSKNKIKSWFQNKVEFDVSSITDEKIINLLKMLKSSKKKKNLLCIASSLEQICVYLDTIKSPKYNLNLKSIITNSESLNQYTKSAASKYFNTPVLSRYSSEELGIIAQQTIQSSKHFIINHASYYVELLHLNNDKPIKSGEYGRIIVTDLFNYAMPMIRYDTGDIAKVVKNSNGINMFEVIEGRKMDLIYDTKGYIISSYLIYTKFYEYYNLLKQYQFIQINKKEYKINLNLKSNIFPFENELVKDFKNDFGNDAIIKIEYVDEIPTLASGKRKKVVNLFNK